MTCRHWTGAQFCGAPETRTYGTGLRCASHTPAALKGRADIEPDPALTLDALRAASGQRFVFRLSDTALNDERAIASGRRRSTPEQYRAAKAEQERRKGETS